MTHMEFARKLKGVFGFPITPFQSDLSVDYDGLAELSDWMAGFPFCAMVAAGGTGEMYSLSVDENVEVVRRVVKAVNGRMPVVGGVGFNLPMAVETAKRMEKAGAAALLVMPPYYTNAPMEGLMDYYAGVGAATALPISLYSRDWAVFSPESVARLAERIPNLVFWKDGQGDARKYQRIMRHVGDRLVWVGGIGDDCVPAYFAVGVQAFTSSISNLAPRLSLKLAELGLKHDFTALDKLMKKYVHPLFSLREQSRGYEVAVMKKAMEILGKPAGPVRPPLHNVKPHEAEAIRTLLEGWGEYL